MWWPSSIVCCLFSLFSCRENQKASRVCPLLQRWQTQRPSLPEPESSGYYVALSPARLVQSNRFLITEHGIKCSTTLPLKDKSNGPVTNTERERERDCRHVTLHFLTYMYMFTQWHHHSRLSCPHLGSQRNFVFSPSSLQINHSLKEGWTNILVPSRLFTRNTDRLSTRCWKSSQSSVPCSHTHTHTHRLVTYESHWEKLIHVYVALSTQKKNLLPSEIQYLNSI